MMVLAITGRSKGGGVLSARGDDAGSGLDDEAPPSTTTRVGPDAGRRRTLLQALISVVTIGLVFFVILPRIADFSEVWQTLSGMTWLELFTLALAAAWNLLTYWILLVAVVPGLRLGQAAVVTQASTAAANTLPGGAAFGLALAYTIYASWGFRRPVIALALLVSGLGDLLAKFAIPVIAVVSLALRGEANVGSTVAALVSVVGLVTLIGGFVLALRSEASARGVGRILESGAALVTRLLKRPAPTRWSDRLVRFRDETAGLWSSRWPHIVIASVVSHLSLFLVLLLALRHLGISEAEVGWAEALGAFAVVRLFSALPLTPGGVGIVELGLTALLVVAGGGEARVVAAVLVFRALTYLLQIPIGAAAYVWWQHGKRWRKADSDSRPT